MSYKHPYVCCKYPMRKVLDSHQENCRAKCRNFPDNQRCCNLDCIYRETGVVVDGVFNEQALAKLYENFLMESGAGKYDQWMFVVEKSIKKCMTISKLITMWPTRHFTDLLISVPKTDKPYICSISEYVIDVVDCLNLMNYLDCPTFQRTEPCLKARDFVKTLDTCGRMKNGTMLINYQYWEFHVINKNEF